MNGMQRVYGDDYDDDEFYAVRRRSNEKPPLWDSFQDPPAKRASGSAANWDKLNFFLKIFKAFTYVVVLGVVLTSSIVSKLTFIFMAAQTEIDRRIPCCNRYENEKKLNIVLPKEEHIVWVWALILAFATPELFTFLRSLRICVFKEVKPPNWIEFFMVVIMELLHVGGLAVLTFTIIPSLDSIRGIMLCSCICFLPGFLQILRHKGRKNWKSYILLTLNILAMLIQLSSFIIWPIFIENIAIKLLAIPLFFTSFRWWENYIDPNSNIGHLIKSIRKTKSRYHIYLYLSPLKVLVFTCLALILHGYPFDEYFTLFLNSWQSHDIAAMNIPSNSMSPIFILLLQIFSSYICYIFAKFACKVKIQEFSFSLPFTLSGPISVIITIAMIQMHQTNVCSFVSFLPEYLAFKASTDSGDLLKTIGGNHLWLYIFWFGSQLWITHHIWLPKNDKNAPTEKLFVCPWYCGFLVDQCITMNRRIVDWNADFLTIHNDYPTRPKTPSRIDIQKSDKIPQLIVCATMWHETQEETIDFLKSILRLDEDQCARRMAMLYINDNKPDDDYYELETNIFFDDALLLDAPCESPKNPPLNEYVKTLIESLPKACFNVYGVDIKLRPPVKIETPYGGRLVWTLPGRTKMIAHLKNKDLIRHKKRWSQVMYMYYLLGFRIMQLENVSAKRKAVIAENTFLLALDGDIDFQPQAVHLLINRMKAIEELGAACGRIHPVGRGPMVWYQKFEYAIGHWLQKATEHVIGCVLCSPGCFSLFRASALMENSVMKKYTTVASEPMHYVQYDQGEDRWLCTLILKQGFRVEYCAASDAYTHSPEIFNEFYNQRRRWVPSTIANICDLLSDSDLVVKKNSSISKPYIFYQCMLMVGTILGPGTIFLMMVGALVSVFSTNIWHAFLWNFFPLLAFIISCIYLNQKYQLLIAFVISSIYCLVMMAVLIGIIIQIIEDGPLAPASVFFLLVCFQIIIAGLMHPQEVFALACGVIYYITIPSMYMLLMIYSVFNMNDVSWGTREVAPKQQDGEEETNSNEDTEMEIEYVPGWLNDPLLVDSELGDIPLNEKRFWRDCIKQYLKPLFQTKDKKAEIAESLRELRNMISFAFVMVNAIFVLIVFLLQLKKDFLHLNWPIDPSDHITFDSDREQIYIYRQYKELDPIGFCFVIFFGSILIIQFIAMFFHRFATISQLLATTQLEWKRSSNIVSDDDVAQEIKGNAVNIARLLQRPSRFDDDDDDTVSIGAESMDTLNGNVNYRRHTICKLHANRNKYQYDYSDLTKNFERRFFSEEDIHVKNFALSRKSVMALNEKRTHAQEHSPTIGAKNHDFQQTLTGIYENPSFVNDV